MNIEQFIIKLNELIELISDTSTKKLLAKIYYPKKKFEVIEDRGDLLLTFIFNYDVSNFDIAGIHLKNINDVEEDLQYIYVGLYEGDDLVINKRDNSINIINHESKVEEKCASNSERFLSNLLEIDRFNLIDNMDNNDKMLLVDKISEYKEAIPFYLTLIRYGF